MNRIIIKYGVDSIERTMDCPTIGALRSDTGIKAQLGFSDNVRFLVRGVEMSDDVELPNGAIVTVETAANSKA